MGGLGFICGVRLHSTESGDSSNFCVTDAPVGVSSQASHYCTFQGLQIGTMITLLTNTLYCASVIREACF